MRRRHFLAAALLQSCRGGAARQRAVEFVKVYLRRIEQLDRAGPMLGSVIEVNPDAMEIARQLDAERAAGRVRGPLHGMPVLVKDNIDTADRMLTTAGSLALIDTPKPKRDAAVVAKLRAAGAVILGKTNLSEWANIRSSRSTSGWSARGGQTRNPHAIDRNPSGSSSGSAVAVAAGFCAAAIGTETDGSIVSPSSVCGIVGIKPTLGLVGGEGIIPIAHSQDTAGPMARTVHDAALVLGAIANKGIDYTARLDKAALRGARLGVARRFFGEHPGVAAAMNQTLDVLRRQGAELIDPIDMPDSSSYQEAELDVLLFELHADLDAYLSARGGAIRSLQQVIEFNERERGREMPHFGQEFFLRAQALPGLDDKRYLAAKATCRRAAESIDAAMEKHRLDAIIAPTDGPACLIDYVHGDRGTNSCSSPAAVAGYPHVTVPAGAVSGLPIGLSFFGRAWSEDALIRLAYAFEQSGSWAPVPKFTRSVA